MFGGLSSSYHEQFSILEEIEGSSLLDTSDCQNFSYMFSKAYSLTALDVSNWATHNVTDMTDMFGETTSLSKKK